MQREVVQPLRSQSKQVLPTFFNIFPIYNNRTSWILEDDIQLMLEFQKTPKLWSKISRKFPGRTQHQIKNRYFSVLAKECGFSRKNLRDFTQRNCFSEACRLALESLQSKREEKNKDSLFLEINNEKNNSRNEDNDGSSMFSWDEAKFQDFMNSKTDEEIFSLLEKGETSL